MTTYKTLAAESVFGYHEDVLQESPGLPGICSHKSLEGALARVDSLMFYDGIDDVFEIAAAYGIFIAQGHVFNDANKRTAFVSMVSFLELNGYNLVDPKDAADMMVLIAEKKIRREDVAAWLKEYAQEINVTT